MADTSKAVGYIRVSTSEQVDSGLGLDAQRAAIEAEAARRGWTLVAVQEDAGLSGKSVAARPGLLTALEQVRSGAAGTLVVAKLDRLSRSLRDFAELMEEATASGWNIVALDLGIDLSTAPGEFLASVMASAARWERRIIGQRTKDALAVKRAQGIRLGRPAQLPPPVAARIVADREAGRSWSEIGRTLDAQGIPTAQGGERWWPASVRDAYTRATREQAASS